MKSEINLLLNGTALNEVAVFRAMHKCFNLAHKSTLIEETHQNYVHFDSLCLPTTTQIKREISDLWIIAYSPKNKDARMTFLQAKFKSKLMKHPFPYFKFSGEYFQYELLANRPDIINASKFNFPKDILSFSDFESIGTYGVFYLDSKGDIDMAFSIANQLHYNRPATKNRQTSRQFMIPILKTLIQKNINGEDELCSSLSLDDFEQCVINLKVGAQFISNYPILFYVISFLRQFKADPVVADFLGFVNRFDIPQIGLDNFVSGGPNILLINVDLTEVGS
jgi:hypothetical protein